MTATTTNIGLLQGWLTERKFNFWFANQQRFRLTERY